MAFFCGADDVVSSSVQLLAHFFELRGQAIHKLLRCDILSRRCLLHFLAVFIHTSDKEHVFAVKAGKTGEHVGGDAFIGVTNVRCTIGIRNGRGNQIRLLCHLAAIATKSRLLQGILSAA